ncbi:hypothetical protein [Mycolicibacterium aubagnense]|uniref:Uncharacterized protein n=1 Tax=Mycolicibacterium aubagnense TaxID=319707 RepID=A0ABN5Z3K4_9MYCO|nr:hypothetical protein [Mycolicibacterium aubagnense]BBX87975.1 hypothetical protein MAUB_58480 [Mycolicibacterium aubagnense]
MALTLDELYRRIDDLHLDELDLIITRDGSGFAVEDDRRGGGVHDIGSSYEVPDSADEHGRYVFSAGPWTAYQYHSSYTAPNRGNYEREIEDLANGDVVRVLVGVTAISENDTWVFAIRSED